MFPPIDPDNPASVPAPYTKSEPVEVSPPATWKAIAIEAVFVVATAEIVLWIIGAGVDFYSV